MFNFSAILKYVLEGLAVALAAFFIPQRKADVKEIVLIALTAAAVFSILDQFSPLTGSSARQGAGFGIGLNQVGWGRLQNNYYGGQDPRLSCTCEVDADYLRSQICTENSSSNSTTTGKNTSASTGANTTGKNTSASTGANTTGNNPGASTGANTTGNNPGASTSDNTPGAITTDNNAVIPGKPTANAAQAITIDTFEPAGVDIINKIGRRTTFQVNSAASGTVEPFDGFTQIW